MKKPILLLFFTIGLMIDGNAQENLSVTNEIRKEYLTDSLKNVIQSLKNDLFWKNKLITKYEDENGKLAVTMEEKESNIQKLRKENNLLESDLIRVKEDRDQKEIIIKSINYENVLLDSINVNLKSYIIDLKLKNDQSLTKSKELELAVRQKDVALANKLLEINNTRTLYYETQKQRDSIRTVAEEENKRADANRYFWYKTRRTLNESIDTLNSLQKLVKQKHNQLENEQALLTSLDQELKLTKARVKNTEQAINKERGVTRKLRNNLAQLGIGFIILILTVISFIVVYKFFIQKETKNQFSTKNHLKTHPYINDNLRQFSFYTKLCEVFRISLFAVYIIVISIILIIAIYIASNSTNALEILQSQDFWKVLITIASPIAFILSTFNIVESKRIEILKIIMEHVDEPKS